MYFSLSLLERLTRIGDNKRNFSDIFLLDFFCKTQITTNQLEQLGFKDSPVATSGKEAIQYIDEKQGEVQCILLDIMMPQENGVETLAEIRKHEKFRREHLEPGHEEEEPIKVIAVTALKHGELLSLCESTGEAGIRSCLTGTSRNRRL